MLMKHLFHKYFIIIWTFLKLVFSNFQFVDNYRNSQCHRNLSKTSQLFPKALRMFSWKSIARLIKREPFQLSNRISLTIEPFLSYMRNYSLEWKLSICNLQSDLHLQLTKFCWCHSLWKPFAICKLIKDSYCSCMAKPPNWNLSWPAKNYIH